MVVKQIAGRSGLSTTQRYAHRMGNTFPGVCINAEGDEMYVYADERVPLERLEALLRRAAGDHALLRAVIERAGGSLE
jgi:hypothetical protein